MTGQSKKALWLALRDYHFDHLATPGVLAQLGRMFGGPDASTKAFASKLSRKLGWPPGFAGRAIAEYKKFVFLGVTSDFVVTPSKVIDQVWHEHLLFTRAYADFCRDVVGRPFDHHPELVPFDDQTGTFQAQYLETLARYQHEFGVEPPADIWGEPKFRPRAESAEYSPVRKLRDGRTRDASTDAPLFAMFSDSSSSSGSPDGGLFGGFDGGGSGGAGASSWWSSSDSAAGGDAGDAGGASAGDGGGSSCSSGCGGGGGGGD